MSYRRMVVRCYHDKNLSGIQQQKFADDVENRLSGTNISGYFISVDGNNWLEWEGDPTVVGNKVSEHVDDSRISDYEIVEDVTISSRTVTNWRSHTDPDLHGSL